MMNTMRKSISLLLTLLLTFSLVSVATAEGNPVLEGVYDLEKNDFGMETFYHFNADGTLLRILLHGRCDRRGHL